MKISTRFGRYVTLMSYGIFVAIPIFLALIKPMNVVVPMILVIAAAVTTILGAIFSFRDSWYRLAAGLTAFGILALTVIIGIVIGLSTLSNGFEP